MSDAFSDVAFERQRVELLPARTVLSTLVRGADKSPRGAGADPIGTLFSHIHVLQGVVPGDGGNNGSVGASGSPSGGV